MLQGPSSELPVRASPHRQGNEDARRRTNARQPPSFGSPGSALPCQLGLRSHASLCLLLLVWNVPPTALLLDEHEEDRAPDHGSEIVIIALTFESGPHRAEGLDCLVRVCEHVVAAVQNERPVVDALPRSEERRVGKEWRARRQAELQTEQ